MKLARYTPEEARALEDHYVAGYAAEGKSRQTFERRNVCTVTGWNNDKVRIGQENEQRVKSALATQERPVPVSELAQLTGIKLNTVSTVMERLRTRGEVEWIHGTVNGARARHYALRKQEAAK